MTPLQASVTSVTDVLDVAAALQSAGSGASHNEVSVRLGSPVGAGGRPPNVDLLSATMLASVLLGERTRHVPLMVTLPSHKNALRQLARGGVLFALAHRDASVTEVVFDEPPFPQDDLYSGWLRDPFLALEPWRRAWRPADVHFREFALNDTHTDGDTDLGSDVTALVGDGFVNFLNPHRVSARRLAQELVGNVAERWLRYHTRGADQQSRLLAAATVILEETLANIHGHAFPPGYQSKQSLVQMHVTRAASSGQLRTLHILVFDTGIGIPASLGPKVSRFGADLDDMDLLELAFDRSQMPTGYDRRRGNGLPELLKMTERAGGSLTVATQSTDTDCVKATVRDGEMTFETVSGAPAIGTFVLAAIPIHPAPVHDTADPDSILLFEVG